MATRQYIGARYVTKIYENSLDPSSAEWESNVNYEPLTLVTYNYGSYLSKKNVPANVGNPANNPTYWVQTGFYNGQIASLQAQVDLLNDERLNLNRRVVVITDSYGKGRGGQVPFTTPLQSYLDVASGDYFAFAEGAMGFVQAGEDGNTAEQLLTAKSGDITSHSTITDIIFALGINDTTSTYNNIISAIVSAVAYAKSEYPLAHIHIAYIGYENRDTFLQYNYINSMTAYIDACDELGVHYLKNVEYVMHYRPYFISDNVHPTTAAGEFLAKKIAQAIDFGSADVKIIESAGTTLVDSNTGVTAAFYPAIIDNGNAQIGFSLDLGAGVTLAGYNFTSVAEFPSMPHVAPNIAKGYIIQAYALDGNNDWRPILIRWYSNHIEINPLIYGGGNVTLAGSIRGCTVITNPTISC